MPIAHEPFGRWPLRLDDYDFVRLLTRSRLAWEYLRRNGAYRRAWRLSAAGRPRPIRLLREATLLRVRRRFRCAETWGLCIFR